MNCFGFLYKHIKILKSEVGIWPKLLFEQIATLKLDLPLLCKIFSLMTSVTSIIAIKLIRELFYCLFLAYD